MTRMRGALGTALAVILLLGAAPTDVEGQRQQRPGMTRPAEERSFRVYGFGGWTPLELDALNARLQSLPEPYTTIPEDMITFGGGAQFRFDHFIVGGEGSVMIATSASEFADQRRARFSAGYGALTLGLSLIRAGGLDIYPLILLGGAGATLDVEERASPSWNELLGDPGRSSVLSTGMLYGAGGLGMDYVFDSGLLIGLRGTWAYTGDTEDWNEEGNSVLGGPSVHLRGPSVRLLIGLGR